MSQLNNWIFTTHLVTWGFHHSKKKNQSIDGNLWLLIQANDSWWPWFLPSSKASGSRCCGKQLSEVCSCYSVVALAVRSCTAPNEDWKLPMPPSAHTSDGHNSTRKTFSTSTTEWPHKLKTIPKADEKVKKRINGGHFVWCIEHADLIDWCCFYYFVRNSLVAVLEALCARIYYMFYVAYHTCKYAYTYTYSPVSPFSWLRAQHIKWCKRPRACIDLHVVSPRVQSYTGVIDEIDHKIMSIFNRWSAIDRNSL